MVAFQKIQFGNNGEGRIEGGREAVIRGEKEKETKYKEIRVVGHRKNDDKKGTQEFKEHTIIKGQSFSKYFTLRFFFKY